MTSSPEGRPLQRVIVFRFHAAYGVCRNRLDHLRRLNPGVPIFGLYGGESAGFAEARRSLSGHLEHVWEIPATEAAWKWRHGDLSLLRWYRELGQQLSFDVLHLTEWDLLVLGTLDDVYGAAGSDGVALAGLTPLERIQSTWPWTSRPLGVSRWAQFRELVRERHGWQGPYLACQGPASVFSRAFLDRYSLEDPPDLVHEELRVPLYAQALGFPVTPLPDIYWTINDPVDRQFFNCDKQAIEERVIRGELAKADGRRVFHPFYDIFDLVPARC
jgi:hypothetical protein